MSANLSQTVTWIPVGERLPEESSSLVEYPVAMPYAAGWHTSSAVWRDGLWMSPDEEEFVYRRVTHWAEPLKHPEELAKEVDERTALRERYEAREMSPREYAVAVSAFYARNPEV